MLQEVDQEAMEEVLGVQLDKEDEDDEDEQEGMRYAMSSGADTCQASAYMVAKLKLLQPRRIAAYVCDSMSLCTSRCCQPTLWMSNQCLHMLCRGGF